MKRWMFVIALATVGCQGSPDDGTEVLASDWETEGLAGAADTRPVVKLDVNESLRARYLKEMICEAVTRSPDVEAGTRVLFSDNCLHHTFTVKAQYVSQKVVYASGRGVTLGLDVEVAGTTPAVTATGTLRRQFDTDFELVWNATATVDLKDDDRYLLRLADETGEYFSNYEDTEYADNVHSIPLDSIPAAVDAVVAVEIEQIQQGFNRGDYANASEAFRIEYPSGEPAGYVVVIEFSVNDPLFDGGGTSLYINKAGVVVKSVDFWG